MVERNFCGEQLRKGCAKLVAGGLQLKDDAKEYFETIKEDAEDVKAAQNAKANAQILKLIPE